MGKDSVSKHSALQTTYSILLIQLLLMLPVRCGESEWLQYCGRCHCSWNSSKKTANCTNLVLPAIPRNLSSDLQYLDLSHNNIAEIQRNEFIEANLQNLHNLFLKNCTLLELNRDALQGLTVLIELDLSDNLLRELKPRTFNGVEKLRKLLLNNNRLEYLPEGLFNNMRYLQILEFKHNHIAQIGPKTFANLPALSVIELLFNNLTVLKVDSFYNLPKLVAISLEENPWNCTCHLLEFRKYAEEKRYYSQPTACYNPPKLNGKLWNDVPTEQFACRPEIIQPQKGLRGGPYGSQVQASNDNVTLTCRVRAAPQPNIAWTYNRRTINNKDNRFYMYSAVEPDRFNDMDIYTSELTIKGVRQQDKGVYACIVENAAGKDTAEMQLSLMMGSVDQVEEDDSSTSLFFIICYVAIGLLILLLIITLVLCCYCRRRRKFLKDGTIHENGLMVSKFDKTQKSSMLEGSVITEVQKSLLTSVNPVEKPPRRTTDMESLDTDDGHEIKKTLLDETAFGNHDEETRSVSLSDTTPRSRQTFVDDSQGTNLPPDLLSFQAKVPQSPSMQSAMSNAPDNFIYGNSPLASPVYQHVLNQTHGNSLNNGIYGVSPVTFRTLQHPKNRNLTLLSSPRNNNSSPFVPAPIVYPGVVMKQGYMTIPRKPRVPSWTPSCSTTLSEFQPLNSPLPSTLSSIEVEPVYDNLGVRTTAGGNSLLNLTKIGISSSNNQSPNSRYTMKDRPLPATPNLSLTSGAPKPSRIYEPIQEVANVTTTSDTEPLYGMAKNGGHGVTIVPSSINGTPERIGRTPPRPPPKPKKKISVTSHPQPNASQLFEDEGEDGTEV